MLMRDSDTQALQEPTNRKGASSHLFHWGAARFIALEIGGMVLVNVDAVQFHLQPNPPGVVSTSINIEDGFMFELSSLCNRCEHDNNCSDGDDVDDVVYPASWLE